MRLLLCLVVLSSACSSAGLKRPTDKQVNFTGTVYLGGAERRGDPLEGATIAVTRAGDGKELTTATSSATGGYRLAFTADADTRVVVAFRAFGLVPTFRALSVGPFTEAVLSVALEPPEPIECSDSQCVGASDDLSLSPVPDNFIGRARVFEPSTETPKLTGLDTLRPIAVAWFQLDAGPAIDAGLYESDGGIAPDDAGTPMLGPPVMRIRVPYASWRRLEDATPGTSGIEVPFLAFDEATGAWVKQAGGKLQSEYGLEIPESALAKVREGQFEGGVVAVTTVTKAGYWTLALPAASQGCVTGTIEADGQAAEGALLSVQGAEPTASRADGSFCLAAPLNTTGALGLQYAGLGYAGGMATAPTAAGTCGATCAAAGKIAIGAAVAAKVCKLEGTAVDAAGAKVAGAVVLAFDESLAGTAFNNLCGKLGTRCTLSTSSDENGGFTLNVPILSGLTVTSTAVIEKAGFVESSRRGTLFLPECPTAPLQLRLASGHDKLELAVTIVGPSISWAPVRPAVAVRVIDLAGVVKWELQAIAGMVPPLTYGMTPQGAKQLTAPVGALAPGDEVSVELLGTGSDGYQFSGGAAAVVP